VKSVIIIAIVFVLLIPIPVFAQYADNVGSGENGTFTLKEALELQGKEIVLSTENEWYPRELTADDVKCLKKMGDAMRAEKAHAPKWQVFCGTLPDKVICNEGLQLIFKSTDDSPACVKSQTAEKLIVRGWAIS